MKVERSRRFDRNLNQTRIAALRRRAERAIADIEAAANITEVAGIRRLASASGQHYRIRIGDYRILITVDGDTAILSGFLHRSIAYRSFP